MSKPPRETREKIFRFVRGRILEGFPPTVREVQAEFGFRAVESAREHLDALVAEDRLAKISGKARGYRLPDPLNGLGPGGGGPPMFVPLMGRVQAGALTLAIEDPQGYVPIQVRRSVSKTPGALFALRVRGESMMGAGIFEGDIVIVHRQPSAESGEIVVAMIGEEATVKRLYIRSFPRPRRTAPREAGLRVELHAENPAFEPIVIEPPDELALLGKVIEVRRYLDGFHG